MNARLPKYVPLFLVWALAVSGCGNAGDASPTAPSAVDDVVFTAEPATIAPEFLSGPGCRGFRPFGARMRITARSRHDLFIRSSRFHFVDRFGVRTVPTTHLDASNPPFLHPLPVPTPVTTPTSGPVPIPGVTIPTPGGSTFDGFLLLSGSRAVVFFLQFGCGIPADGTLFGELDFRDHRGTWSKSHVRARIAE